MRLPFFNIALMYLFNEEPVYSLYWDLCVLDYGPERHFRDPQFAVLDGSFA
jgi:hypothetical protein